MLKLPACPILPVLHRSADYVLRGVATSPANCVRLHSGPRRLLHIQLRGGHMRPSSGPLAAAPTCAQHACTPCCVRISGTHEP